jgi:hypothetical protein
MTLPTSSNPSEAGKTVPDSEYIIIDNDQDTGGLKLVITAHSYDSKAIDLEGEGDIRQIDNPISTFAFPLPEAISDSTGADYNRQDSGAFRSALEAAGVNDAAMAAESALAKGAGSSFRNMKGLNLLEAGSDMASGVGGAMSAFGNVSLGSGATNLGRAFAEKRSEAIFGLGNIARKGSIGNPRTLTAFNNMKLKSYSYSWTFVPRSPEESIQITKAINILKYFMSPNTTANGSRFIFPELFTLRFSPKKLSAHLYQPNICVLEDLQVSYNTETGPSFFQGTNAPTQIQLQLTFGELVVETKKNISEKIRKSNSDIGI